ncbi:MAG: FAD-dependent oxidoreductase [Phycisphaerae bacterium]|nr:FAD-dependent oxidoreductase [Phycisphaerae bacterium]
MTERSHEQSVTRRDILRTAGAGGLITATITGRALEGNSLAVAKPLAGGEPSGQPQSGRLVTPQRLEAQVIVAGGGMAGVCAAIAAARNGVSVLLLQDRPVLGGNASSEIRMHIVGSDGGGQAGKTDARESGIIEELRLEDAVRNPQRSPSMWDVLLYDAVKREPNISLLLNTSCAGVQMDAGRIIRLFATRESTEESFTVQGKLFIDCTGDGRLAAEAGAEFRMGREAQAEYGESLAPETADSKTLGSSIMFMTRKHERPMPFVPPKWIRRFPDCSDLPHRGHGSWEYGFWWIEWGGELDTIKDNERIRDQLLAMALGVWDHIKNSGKHPNSANWALDWIGFLPGKRESRRFIGDYVLRQQDVQKGATFEDGVALGGWPIDLHPPEGILCKDKPFLSIPIPLYNIPFRCLYSRNVSNLLLAGRNISVSHVAFGTTRVMGTCSTMGQAVGTAAAMCVKRGCSIRQLRREGIEDLRQQLLKDDAYLVGASNADPADLARKATVRASSETPVGPAANVVNGVHRVVYDKSNRWMSDPARPMPQWLELRFDAPKLVREVHLTFDTALIRKLTLSHSDSFDARMIRGPQPETVRDYELFLLDGDKERSVASVQGNYQRKRVHTFEPATASGIRLLVKASWGDPSARVFEIRAYR